ncbi:hypothetical protein CDAR_478941 [Caerostris darwini]|uniref:Uncharacterized protein n=1 Tax=Caerostris darwini TaxID=1538125 RepID=A0AAV4RRU3_9ARAC|nr:hypothetical protein CDAR_478941 [Caerostris darwini]
MAQSQVVPMLRFTGKRETVSDSFIYLRRMRARKPFTGCCTSCYFGELPALPPKPPSKQLRIKNWDEEDL